MESILRELATPKFLALYLFVASVCYVHFRGKVRLRFGRQMFEHSGLLAPYNSLLYLFSAVPNRPVLDVEDFPQLAPLRENWKMIRDEALALYEADQIRGSEDHNDLAFLAFYKRGWKRFYMKWYDDAMPSALRACPRTVELVNSIPEVNAAAFTLLPPGAELGKHRDPFASSLRYHLGLATPNSDACRIWVDGHEYSWRDGQDFVFDETFVHWAENKTDQTRIILFVDFTRPLRTRAMRAFNRFMIRHVFHVTKSQNREEDGVGLANRVTPVVYRIKYWLLGVKKAHRKGYYVAKYTLFAGLVYLVFLHGSSL